MSTVLSRIEKESRDPVEVLRMHLKDATESSVLNTQQLLEIKYEYLQKQESTRGQLDGFVQSQIDEIERASSLLAFDKSISNVSKSLKEMGDNCQRMRKELGDEGVASDVSIARRNLKDLQAHMTFYQELPQQLETLQQLLLGNLGELVHVFSKWQTLDEWRQKMLHQVCGASYRSIDTYM
jgi:exocyst complex component 3